MVGETVLPSKGSIGPGFAVLSILQAKLGHQFWTDATPFALTALKANVFLVAEVVVSGIDAVDGSTYVFSYGDRLCLSLILPRNSQGKQPGIPSFVQGP
jgi:hypothetical protein